MLHKYSTAAPTVPHSKARARQQTDRDTKPSASPIDSGKLPVVRTHGPSLVLGQLVVFSWLRRRNRRKHPQTHHPGTDIRRRRKAKPKCKASAQWLPRLPGSPSFPASACPLPIVAEKVKVQRREGRRLALRFARQMFCGPFLARLWFSTRRRLS